MMFKLIPDTSKVFLSFLVFLVASCASSSGDTEYYHNDNPDAHLTHVSGTVHGFSVKDVLVIKYGEDFTHNPDFDGYRLKVTHRKFEENLPLDSNQVYVLHAIRDGKGAFINFFADNDTLVFDTDSENIFTLSVYGEQNRLYRDFKQSDELFRKEQGDSLYALQDALWKKDTYYTKEYDSLCITIYNKDIDQKTKDSLFTIMREMSISGNCFSSEGKALHKEFSLEHSKHIEHTAEYLAETVPSMATFLVMTDCIRLTRQRISMCEIGSSYMIDAALKLLPVYDSLYADKFEGCSLHEEIRSFKSSIAFVEGSRMPDFTLPSADGSMVSLYSLIDGKAAVVELWASWCGSCRRHASALIPLYNQYKAKGVEFVGVAREYKNDSAWKKALELDNYPWPNLLALDEDHLIWHKLDCGNAAGATILIDKNGCVVKINPTIEYLKEYFSSL